MSGTEYFESAIAPPLMLGGMFLIVVISNFHWLVWGVLYRGSAKIAVRTLWILYLIIPLIVGGLLLYSAHMKPIRNGCEPFTQDGRPELYVFLLIIFDTLVAIIGTIVMAHSHSAVQESGNGSGDKG